VICRLLRSLPSSAGAGTSIGRKEKEIAGNEDDSEGDARIVSVEVMRIGYTGFRKSIGRRGLCFTADPDSTTSTQS